MSTKGRVRDQSTGVEVGVPAAPKKMSAYQAFVKARNGEVARAHPHLKQTELMQALGAAWNGLGPGEREDFEHRSERDFKRKGADWDAGRDEREFERMGACKTLGVGLSTE